MAAEVAPVRYDRGLGRTGRRDAWWASPVVSGAVLVAFIVYATARAASNVHYQLGHGTENLPEHSFMLSPFYSPLLLFPWVPDWLSPAFLILWAPGGFRVTCYYYRKAYYRSLFLDPPACAVSEHRGESYRGETNWLAFQNAHRAFLYLAVVFLVILGLDAWQSARWPAADGRMVFGASLGTLVLVVNVVLLFMYTFSCHSLRHLVGGSVDCFSCSLWNQTRYRMWNWVSHENARHQVWAWTSLVMVALADFYVWMVASGRLSDPRLL